MVGGGELDVLGVGAVCDVDSERLLGSEVLVDDVSHA